jgi:hypothetical protein
MNTEEYLNQFGQQGSESRLSVIASMNLGERSEAAAKVLQKRLRRKELMNMGHPFDNANIIVKAENENNQ